jgi:HK97 gp10 family phage protein
MPITVTGLKELSDALTTQSNEAAKRYLSKVMQPAADIVVAACEETAPVAIGILEESIVTQKKWTSGDGETSANIAIGPLKSIFYGTFQEWGTKTEPPQFWMTRAWEGCKDKVLEQFVEGAKEMTTSIKAK